MMIVSWQQLAKKILFYPLRRIPLLAYYWTYLSEMLLHCRIPCRSVNPIIVYQMARVGSRTVEQTLKNNVKAPVFHAHYLSETEYQLASQHDLKRGRTDAEEAIKRARFDYLRKLVEPDDKKRWKVITLVRDPIANVVSVFSYLFFRYNSDTIAHLNGDNEEKALSVIMEAFEREKDEHIQRIARWFDAELRSVFGVDIYQSDFPHGTGFNIYQSHRADVLLLRLEDLDSCHKDAFQEFLGVKNVELTTQNTAEQIGFSTFYSKIKKTLRFTPEFLDYAYTIKWVRHLYTSEEIDFFRARWLS